MVGLKQKTMVSNEGSLGSAAAQARLKTYASVLGNRLSGNHFTMNGFRSGVAVSLALEGMSP